jgi:hypothetical protein
MPFELISDPDETLCAMFDVMKMKNMYGKKVRGIERSTFVIDEIRQIGERMAWSKSAWTHRRSTGVCEGSCLDLQNPLNSKEFFVRKAVCGLGHAPSQTAFLLFDLYLRRFPAPFHPFFKSRSSLCNLACPHHRCLCV